LTGRKKLLRIVLKLLPMKVHCETMLLLGEKPMAKTQTISARIDPVLKANAEGIFNNLGLTTSQAIQDARTGTNLSGSAGVDEMFKDLESD
jgi:hypothetical protein